MRVYEQKYLPYENAIIRVGQSFFLRRWLIETRDFPSMVIRKVQRFGWDADAACTMFDRQVAVSEAVRALQGHVRVFTGCNLIYRPDTMSYWCESCHETLEIYEVDQMRHTHQCRI